MRISRLRSIFFIGCLLYGIAYTLLVTPKRFLQCLGAPIAYLQRFSGNAISDQRPSFLGGHDVDLFTNEQILAAIVNDIDEAQTLIQWQVMLFQPDEAGQHLAQAIVNAAQRGVRVQLSFDIAQSRYGSLVTPYSTEKRNLFDRNMAQILNDFELAGVEVLDSPPGIDFNLGPVSEEARALQETIERNACMSFNHYDHRKFLIIDHAIAFVGSANVGNEYLYEIPLDPAIGMFAEAEQRARQHQPEAWPKWQESMLRIRGPIVQSLSKEFNLRWEILGGHPVTLPAIVPEAGSVEVKMVVQRPGTGQISTYYLDAIRGAKENILIASPYVSHDLLLNALIDASRRGVEVVLVVPGDTNDVPISRDIFRSHTQHLLKSGIMIYENNLRMFHSKIMIVDNQWVTLGSFNLNYRSVAHDQELNLVVHSRQLADEIVKRIFEPYRQQSHKLEAAYSSALAPIYWIIAPFT
jgi:cardiolipin synthase